MTLTRRTAAIVACVAVFVSGAPEVCVASASPTTTPAPSTSLSLTKCPALYVFGVQGTGESSPDAAPSTDTGMLSLVMRPMMAAAPDPGLVDRAYVPYPAGFGGAVGTSIVPYAESVTTGVLRTESMMAQLHSVCPRTRVGLVSYSQGSHVASIVAQQIGAGHGVVDPSLVAAVILIADPTRSPGTGLFPGTDSSAPAPAPGTSGKHLAALPAAPVRSGVAGGGIGPQRDIAEDFGALTGRVASVCVSGDLACDTPEGSAILRAAAGVASQSLISTGDPIGSLISIGQALAYTSLNAAVTVIDESISGDSSALGISPQKSISQRLADASDPRAGLDVNAALAAVRRVGTIGFDAVNAVVASVLNPAALTQLAAVALSNPAAAVVMVGEKFTSAVGDLVAPTTGDRLVSTAFDVVRREVADNRDLLDLTTWVRIWETGMRHDAYSHAVGGGPSPAAWAGAWLAAAAHDAAAAPLLPARTGEGSPPSPTTLTRSVLVSTSSAPFSVDLPAPTTSSGPSPLPVEVVGAPQHIAAPPTELPRPTATVPVTVVGPSQPGVSADATRPPTSSVVARQPGITDPTR
ncbi:MULTISPECIES: cutinase family protein [Nocardia]|uniref:cutinase family protein n=1 Tax=Nocardia TaxID=1817 RepID=UPI002658629A|nr:cutinase family protein [Nocardia sp. PE-7]WKG08856.1 cutinase family protein [Nocardia sp. PE-7]